MIHAVVGTFEVQQRRPLATEAMLGATEAYVVRHLATTAVAAEIVLVGTPARMLCTCQVSVCAHVRALRQLRGSWSTGSPPVQGGSLPVVEVGP